MSALQRLRRALLSEGKGMHTDRFQRCLQHILDQEGSEDEEATSKAYAICTSTFQKAKMFRKGSQDLTKKGSRLMKPVPVDEAKKGAKTPTLRLKNGLMGMRGGLISITRIVQNELSPMRENVKHQKLYVELQQAVGQLERAHALVASLAEKVPEKV